MSKVTFKFPQGIKAECKLTGFSGIITIRSQMINGCIQYALQPKSKKNSNYIPDAYHLDEQSLVTEELTKPETVNFAFETGDRVRNRISGFTGIVVDRVQFFNKCIAYKVEGPMKDEKEMKIKAWEQELELIDKGLNAKGEEPVKRKKTGGHHSKETVVQKVDWK